MAQNENAGRPGLNSNRARDEAGSSALEAVVIELRTHMRDELAKLNVDGRKQFAVSEARMKSLAAFLKALQAVEDMANRLKESRAQQSRESVSTVEFRGQLEKQIQAVVDEASEGTVS